MRSKRRARLRAVGLVGVPILLLLVNFGLWWGEEYLKNYVAAFPTNHFFADDYELQTLLEIKENVVSGAHRVAQSGFQQLLNGILGNNKQDIKQILGNILQPETFHLGLVRAGLDLVFYFYLDIPGYYFIFYQNPNDGNTGRYACWL